MGGGTKRPQKGKGQEPEEQVVLLVRDSHHLTSPHPHLEETRGRSSARSGETVSRRDTPPNNVF